MVKHRQIQEGSIRNLGYNGMLSIGKVLPSATTYREIMLLIVGRVFLGYQSELNKIDVYQIDVRRLNE